MFKSFLLKGMYLTVETDNIQFCTKRVAEGSNGYSTSRQIVSGQTRVCEVGSFQRDQGEVSTAVSKAGRTEVKSGEASSGNVEQEQEQEVMEVLKDKAVSSDQQDQIIKDRNMRNKKGLRSTGDKRPSASSVVLDLGILLG